MNKSQILTEMNDRTGLSKQDCRLCLDAILTVIKDALKQGQSVTLSNFGKFKVNEVKSKSIYSFKTKTTEKIESKKSPSFKASLNLKQQVK